MIDVEIIDAEAEYGRIASVRRSLFLRAPAGIAKKDPALTRPEQQLAWVKAAQEGDPAAAMALLKSTEGFIWSTVNKYGGATNDADYEDMRADSRLALLEAIPRFDFSRGLGWINFAGWQLRAAITRWRENHGRTVRVPSYMLQHKWGIGRHVAQFHKQFGRAPTDDELCDIAQISSKTLARLRTVRTETSFDDPIGEDGDRTLHDLLSESAPSVEDTLVLEEKCAAVRDALAKLPPNERVILERRFGIRDDSGRTLKDVGRDFGVSRERVRQIEKQALLHLRAILSGEGVRFKHCIGCGALRTVTRPLRDGQCASCGERR